MNKSELIAAMSEKNGLTKADSQRALESLLEVITEALAEGEKVQLVGFGTFETRERKARMGRNPRNPEEPIEIPASTAAVFRAGKNLKEEVNK